MKSEYLIVRSEDKIVFSPKNIKFKDKLVLCLGLLLNKEITFRKPIVEIYNKGEQEWK